MTNKKWFRGSVNSKANLIPPFQQGSLPSSSNIFKYSHIKSSLLSFLHTYFFLQPQLLWCNFTSLVASFLFIFSNQCVELMQELKKVRSSFIKPGAKMNLDALEWRHVIRICGCCSWFINCNGWHHLNIQHKKGGKEVCNKIEVCIIS